jgi:hypothetical protein
VRESQKYRLVCETQFWWLERKSVTDQNHQFKLFAVHLKHKIPTRVKTTIARMKPVLIQSFSAMHLCQVVVKPRNRRLASAAKM